MCRSGSPDAAGNLKPWGQDMADTVAGQMRAQEQAAQGTGASIDWHIQQADTFFNDIASECPGVVAFGFEEVLSSGGVGVEAVEIFAVDDVGPGYGGVGDASW